MSNASVDFPEPETPVITVNLSCGILTLIFFRLCSRACKISILWARRRSFKTVCSARPSPSAAFNPRTLCSDISLTVLPIASGVIATAYSLNAAPVCERGSAITVSGLPETSTSPPVEPPSGPKSITQSAARITSRLCSIINSV